LLKVVEHPELAHQLVLLGFRLPLGACGGDVAFSQKVALRDVNAHSIVNASTRFTFKDGQVDTAALVFGGIAPLPFRASKTEYALVAAGVLSLNLLPALSALLEAEVRDELGRWAARMEPLPYEGFSDEYRVQLALSFLYKAIVHALLQTDAAVPAEIASSGRDTWGRWPVSEGSQSWEHETFKRPVALPYIKVTAMYQCSGQIHYTQERAVPPRTANAAMVVSTRALANYRFVVPDADNGSCSDVNADALRHHLASYASSFIDLVTHESIKDGGINLQGMGGDQPLFAEERVSYSGQSIALVLAETEQEAIRIARYVTRRCVAYSAVTWPAPWNDPKWAEPIVGIEEALQMGSIFPDSPDSAAWNSHIWKITRPGSRFDWITPDKDPLDDAIVSREATVDGVTCQIVESSQRNGGQAHFYMETQACIAEPADQRRMIIHSSTQSPMAMHQTTAMALGVEYHRVDVQIPPVGGGFGGKTEQARFVVGPTAVAAHVLKRPVRLAMRREEDTALIGKRHAYYGQSQVAIDRGQLRAEDRGILRGVFGRMWGDGGAFYDCSFIVSNCIQLRADNAYQVTHFENQIDVCRTNTSPSTAFRAFGDAQCKNIQENAIDDAAFSIGMWPEEVREKNLYQRGQVTPFGQALSDCYMREVWAYLKHVSRYEEKRRAVDDYNRQNRWRKRGLSMIPVKYGSGYNLVQLEQASAYITVNQGDGSVIVHQGGVEIGQGLTTQVQQVASYVLNVPMGLIYVESVSTGVMPNATSTGGSTGTPYNAEVVKQTCQKLAARLNEFGQQMRLEQGEDWCKQQLIDFWNYPDTGWATKVPSAGPGSKQVLIWQKLVSLAYAKRVELTCSFTAKIEGGSTPVPCMTFKARELQPTLPGVKPGPEVPVTGAVDSFVGFTYSAACSVVELDILTGEVKILSADIVYDMGRSMNPAIDIGQVEGAFMQGVGYFLTEKLVFEPRHEEKGRLNSVNTWDYKPPASTSVPLELNVYLFPRGSVPNVPESPNDVFSAKEVGEPPLVLSNTVFFAVKAAVRASRVERGRNGLFRMDAPATVEEVRRACDISIADLG
jgi:xanthine dehydrogenase/oxidase